MYHSVGNLTAVLYLQVRMHDPIKQEKLISTWPAQNGSKLSDQNVLTRLTAADHCFFFFIIYTVCFTSPIVVVIG